MQSGTVGTLLVDEALPQDMRGRRRTLDKKELSGVLAEVAQQHPEEYSRVAKSLSDIGWRAAQARGGFSFGLQHLRKSRAAAGIRQQLERKIQGILADPRLNDQQREDAVIKATGEMVKPQQEQVFAEALAARNPLALQVQSGARGNKLNVNSLIGSDMLYTDQHDNVIPIPVLHSYSEGLTPAEYWAGAYGARRGVVNLKLATADAGYLSKLLSQATHRLVVSGLDSEQPDDTVRGLPVDTSDQDNEGSLLSQDTGRFKRNTVLTPALLKELERSGHKRILVRSPTVGGPRDGVFARDVGVREHGTLAGRGEYPGMTASQAISEPLSQSQIGSKHSGGVIGASQAVSGFDYIAQYVHNPKTFKGGAVHSTTDGIVGRVDAAPAGGQHVYVDGEQHYVPPTVQLTVKPGDRVEAGDVLTTGLPHPGHVAAAKGIGEGRRVFVHAFRNAMQDAGLKAHRRNVELLARGLIDHVRLTDEMGPHAPDDILAYHQLEHDYQPRQDAKKMPPEHALGKYLEAPVLHYTIGTKVRPSVQKTLTEFGVKEVHVHDQPPPFEPEVLPGAQILQHDEDFMTRMYGTGLKSSLLDAAHRGSVSDARGSSFVPGLARGVDFGHVGLTKKPEEGMAVKVAGIEGRPSMFGDALKPGVNAAVHGTPSLPGGVKPLGGGGGGGGGSSAGGSPSPSHYNHPGAQMPAVPAQPTQPEPQYATQRPGFLSRMAAVTGSSEAAAASPVGPTLTGLAP